MKHTLQILFLLALTVSAKLSYAQADPVEHVWYNTKKTAKIQIYKAKDGKYYGKIVWLAEPNRDGKPKVDRNNPDVARRNDPIINLLILKRFDKDGEHGYENGSIYDPENGKTYKCKMTLEGNNLDVRGYIGFSMLGRTEHWTKAD